MLVLTRRQSQDIDIVTPDGEMLIIRLVKMQGNQCRIGVIARKEVKVDRFEGFRGELQDRALSDIINKKRKL